MPTSAVETFAGNVRRSTLLSSDRWSQFERECAPWAGASDPRPLADQLVARGWLTPWQAGMLLTGRDAFFLGRYKLLDQLGEGGMGTVFKAEQTPLGRIVALKVMSSAVLKDPSAVARFHREIQAAAALAHPHVVAAIDAESVGDTHFLVMEYVAGRDLSQYAVGNRGLPVGWACECVRQAALGLQHAHERGMVHRDIKPANLLVATSSAGGEPSVKILDMGLARFVSESTEDGGLTGVGQVMGTPDYISPEQARDTHAADIRSDIFSLGCTLFRLLAGRVPFEGQSVVEKLMVRTTRDAPRLGSFRPDIPPELDALVARMMARDPARRFQTPLETALALAPFCRTLGSELEAPSGMITAVLPRPQSEFTSVFEPTNPTVDRILKTLSHAPVEDVFAETTSSLAASASRLKTATLPARPGGPNGGRTHRKRSPARLAALAAVVVAVLLSIGWGIWLAVARGTVVLDWPPAEREGAELTVDGRTLAVPPEGPMRVELRPGRHRLNLVRPGFENVELAALVERGAEIPLPIDWTPTARTRRHREWQALGRVLPPQRETVSASRAPAPALAAKLHAFRLRWAGSDESLLAAREAARLEWPLDRLAAADLPERERFAWHPPELVSVLGERGPGHMEQVHAVVYRPDGGQIASCGGDGWIRLWDPATMRPVAEIERSTRTLAYTPDSRFLIAGGAGAVFYDVSGEAPLEKLSIAEAAGQVGNIVLSPDDRTLVLIDAKVRLFDLTAWPPQERDGVAADRWSTGAAFTPDSQTLITFSGEKTIKLWNLAADKSPALRARLEAHGAQADGDYICGVVVSADGKRMVSSGVWDWNLLTWDLQVPVPRDPTIFHLSTAPTVISRSADARLYAVGCWEGVISLFDLTVNSPPPLVTLKGHTGQVWGAAFSPDGKHLVSGGNDGALRVWNIDGALSEEHELPRIGHRRLVSGVAFSPDGEQLISTGHDGRTIVWDVATRRPLREFPRLAGPVLSSVLSPDGTLLAVGDQEHAALRLVDTATGQTRHVVHGMPWPAMFRFSPDGTRIAAPVGETVRAWDVSSGGELPAVGEYRRAVSAFAFFPDGQTLAAGIGTAPYTPPATGDVQTWDMSGKERRRFPGEKPDQGVAALDCSPDGRKMAVALQPSGLRLWDLAGRAPAAANVAAPAITALAFSPDGRRLVTLAAGAQVVTLHEPATGAEFKSWRLPCQPHSLTFSPDSRHVALGNADGTICILRVE